MKIIGVIVTTFALGFVAFQNCQKAPTADSVSNAAVDLQNVSSKIDLSAQKITAVSFLFTETETIAKSAKFYQISVNKELTIDLLSGEMLFTSDTAASSTKYCLTETLKDELVSILKAAQICKGGNLSEGKMCAQVMKLPYAVLTAEKDTYPLGSATDGCGSNSMDLCEDQSTSLKAYFASLKSKYTSFTCP